MMYLPSPRRRLIDPSCSTLLGGKHHQHSIRPESSFRSSVNRRGQPPPAIVVRRRPVAGLLVDSQATFLAEARYSPDLLHPVAAESRRDPCSLGHRTLRNTFSLYRPPLPSQPSVVARPLHLPG